MKKLFFLLPVLMSLFGCASHLSQQQCASMNWQSEGFNDGLAGRSPRDLSRSMKDCSEYGISVNSSAYQAGWRDGVRQYCTPDYNLGYTDGVAGVPEATIHNRWPICQQAQVKLNLTNYNAGRQKGLLLFCTHENGLNLARQGQLVSLDLCPPHLRHKFNAGFMEGKEKFCSYPENGFALGKENKPYPVLCSPAIYLAFKSEYDRGVIVAQRSGDLQGRINALNETIKWKAYKHGLIQKDDGFYRLGWKKDPAAEEALSIANTLVGEKQHLEKELFKAQVVR
ncbi:MAG: DUF2799 domain-containing protein [Proteobacteria bacterium]|nr:DUF2799 domain-containing protein [Pseudomonadota bacterium]